MGWLLELSKGARFGSLGKLARAATHHEDWPESEATNPRSIENMLRLLDSRERKGQVWLDNRPEVRDILADLLTVSPESLDPGLLDQEGPANPRVVLKELREARPIDLRKEELYPGIPKEVLHPAQWGRVWWRANTGAGKTLVGKWLEARKLATFLRVDRLADAVPILPDSGAVYIELAHPTELNAAAFMEEVAGCDLKICVAAPFLPEPSARQTAPPVHTTGFRLLAHPQAEEDETKPVDVDGWTSVETPPPGNWVTELIHWVGARMESGGGFDVDTALALFEDEVFRTWLATPGDYIGVCGLIEKFGTQRLEEGLDSQQLATAFLETRLERTDLTGRGLWTSRELWRLFCGCVEVALVFAGTEDTLSSEQMLRQHLPADALPPTDETILHKLRDAPPSNVKDYQEALRRVSPTPEGAVRELLNLHLLEPVGGGAVVLRPTWLTRLATEPVFDRLVKNPSLGLGALFLRPHTARRAIEALRETFLLEDHDKNAQAPQAEVGWAVVRFAVAELRSGDPSSVALLEGAFVAVGLALLDRRVPARLPELRALWDLQLRLAVSRYTNAPPEPRVFVLPREEEGWAGVWDSAALAISERLHQGGIALPVTDLSPWAGRSAPEHFEQTLSSLQQACVLPLRFHNDRDRQVVPPDFFVDVWRLAGRLYARFGIPTEHGPLPMVLAPFELIRSVKEGRLESWPGHLVYDYEMDALEALAEDAGLSMDAVLDALWRLKEHHSDIPLISRTTSLDDAWKDRIWHALPVDVFRDRLETFLQNMDSVSWERLSPAHWEVLLSTWRRELQDPLILAHITEAQARTLLRNRLKPSNLSHSYKTLWGRFPDMCMEETLREISDPLPDNFGFSPLWWMPDSLVAVLIAHVRLQLAQVRSNPVACLALIRWAHHQCSKRGEGWRASWDLLNLLAPLVPSDPGMDH